MCSECDQEFANNSNSIRPEDLDQYVTVSIAEVTTTNNTIPKATAERTTANTTSESTAKKLATDNSASAIATTNSEIGNQ
jgi:hypothetical protein